MTEAASNALLFEQEIDERVAAALIRVLAGVDMSGLASELVHQLLMRHEVQRYVEESCAAYVNSMQHAVSTRAPMAKWSNF